MSEHKYWRHRWSPQHVTTADMTGTINAPQWEPVHVLNDAELAARVAPTREQLAEALELALTEFRDKREIPRLEDHLADAILALMQELAEGSE